MRCLCPEVVRRGVCVSILLALFGCRSRRAYVVPEEPMPPNTVLLSQMMRELSATPGFTDAMLAQLDKGGKKGPALMTPALMKRLRELILGKDWQGLDRFPGWTMQGINPTVKVAGRVVAKEDECNGSCRAAPWNTGRLESTKVRQLRTRQSTIVDLGAYSLEKAETVNLDEPSRSAGVHDGGYW